MVLKIKSKELLFQFLQIFQKDMKDTQTKN